MMMQVNTNDTCAEAGNYERLTAPYRYRPDVRDATES